jgi:gliding motility-associated-like protein
MRKKITFYLSSLLILLSSITNGQGFYNTVNWKFSNPTQMGITFFDVDFFDNNNVIAVGSAGGIAKSTDGGRNWKYGPFSFVSSVTNGSLLTTASLNDVHYATVNVAYAVGDRGCMAKTTDGGQNWSFVKTPLFEATKNINAVWFLNQDTGYIGGQSNSIDSIPKLYITKNGGATWDSIAAPTSNGKSRVGYVNNPNIPSVLDDVTAKGKDIYHIEFLNDSIGYVSGSASQLFPRASQSANAPTATLNPCLPNGGNLTGSASNAALLWKINKAVLTDYSLSKERLGYLGIVNTPVTCTSSYNSAQFSPVGQTYRAMTIINDSSVIMMSFNNNNVIRVNTGKNDSTLNVNNAGVYEKGKYIILNQSNFPFGGPQTGPQIPPVQVLLSSNPYQMKRASNGKLYANGGFGRLWTSIDNGANWIEERSYPVGKNYSQFANYAMDIAPNGKFIFMGAGGVIADSIPGGAIFSNYNLVAPSGGYSKIEFADCNTGIAAGGSSITRTLDGGNTWLDNARPDFAASFYSINGMSYPKVNKAYFAVSNGTVYRSDNANAAQAAFVLDPVYSDANFQMNDVVAIGNDTVYALGYSSFAIAAASRKSTIFRSFNNGVTWQAIDIVASTATPAFTAPTLSQLTFPSRNIGYAAGSRNGIYKTTDGGATWTSMNPFPAVNQFPPGFPNTAITYTEIMAVDDNTVFVVGNMFTTTGIKRVYKTIDGGANWIDITGNIPAQFPVGNTTGVLFHDANNGYIIIGSTIFKTTDGGTTWVMDISPTGLIGQTLAFAPRKVPAGIAMQNRRMFFGGFSGPGGLSATIMEYGNPANTAVNSTEVVDGSCSSAATGSIIANVTGGIPPYTYSLNGGPFQTSNTFLNILAGTKTLVIKDAQCGVLTKAIIVDVKQSPIVSAGPPKTIVSGEQITLDGSTGNNIASSIAWTPAASLTGANTLTPIAKPTITTNYTLTVVNSNGCTSTDAALVTVLPYCIKVMDAFTPNGDNTNDKWLVTQAGACTTQSKVSVYNRYGSEVYSNTNYQNDWTGTYKGKTVPDGTYYYQIEFTLVGGRKIFVKGDVTILR